MRYRVLGQLEVVGPHGTVQVAAPRQRIVLAMLLLEANHVVPVDRLVDAVWDEGPPFTARGQIQICVSALRRSLSDAGLPDAIVTQPPGYLFRSAEGELDLHQFDRLVARGRTKVTEGRLTEAAELYGDALALWRGQPFAGIQSRVLQAAAVNLTERHLALLEDNIDVRLQLGRHHELIGELMVLTADHPIRERLRAQLMIALYRDGRQAEALDVYRQARQAFIDELGLEPGRTLQQLERAILAGDPELDVPVPVRPPPRTADSFVTPRLLPADIADFTGQRAVAGQIRDLLAPGRVGGSNAAGIVAISGMGGSGKTTVAVHVAHELAQAFPDGQLYVTLRGGEAQPVAPAKVLERFLRALGVPGSAVPEGLEERAEMYRDRLAGRRVLVVLDDAASEEQLLPLLPAGSDSAVIVTSRQRLTRLPGAHRIDLGALETDAALELLSQVAGADRFDAEPEESRTLVKLCGSLPLALRIAGARLAARPHWTVGQLSARLADEHRRLDELAHGGVGIRTSIAVAYDGLSPEAQRLFRRLALLEAPDFAAWVSVPLLATNRERAEDLLESLVDVQLLEVERVGQGGAAGSTVRYRFHDLIRVFARERLDGDEPAEERHLTVQRLLGSWLCLARAAHRREYGGDFTVLHGRADAWPLPEALLAELLVTPLDWYESERASLVLAVRQAADLGMDELCWDLAVSTVTLFEAHSYLDDWRETHEIALAATRRAGNRRGEAVMLYSLGALNLVERRFEEATAGLSRALDMFVALGDAHGCGLTERHLAYLDRVHRSDLPGALRRYENALAALRSAGDRIGEAHVLSNLAQVRMEHEQYAEVERLLAAALGIARSAGARRVEAQTLHRLGESYVRRGDLISAGEAFQAVLTVVRASGDQVGEAYARHGLGVVQTRLGQHREAEPTLDEAYRIAVGTGERLLAAQALLTLGELCIADDRVGEAVGHLEEAQRQFERLGAGPWQSMTERMLEEISASPVG